MNNFRENSERGMALRQTEPYEALHSQVGYSMPVQTMVLLMKGDTGSKLAREHIFLSFLECADW